MAALTHSNYASPDNALVNIVTEQIAHNDENSDNAVNLGQWKLSHHRNCQQYVSGYNMMSHD